MNTYSCDKNECEYYSYTKLGKDIQRSVVHKHCQTSCANGQLTRWKVQNKADRWQRETAIDARSSPRLLLLHLRHLWSRNQKTIRLWQSKLARIIEQMMISLTRRNWKSEENYKTQTLQCLIWKSLVMYIKTYYNASADKSARGNVFDNQPKSEQTVLFEKLSRANDLLQRSVSEKSCNKLVFLLWRNTPHLKTLLHSSATALHFESTFIAQNNTNGDWENSRSTYF